jgi:hypothetical protein
MKRIFATIVGVVALSGWVLAQQPSAPSNTGTHPTPPPGGWPHTHTGGSHSGGGGPHHGHAPGDHSGSHGSGNGSTWGGSFNPGHKNHGKT